MKNKTQFFKDIVYRIAQQSECLSRQVGCIVVKDRRIVAEGWNAPPKKTDVASCQRCNKPHVSGQNLEQALCAHAEINAISSAAYLGYSIKDAELYCTVKPCAECMKAIIACGIKNVYFFEDYETLYTDLFAANASVGLHKL